MHDDPVLGCLIEALRPVPGLAALVLGGSTAALATTLATPASTSIITPRRIHRLVFMRLKMRDRSIPVNFRPLS